MRMSLHVSPFCAAVLCGATLVVANACRAPRPNPKVDPAVAAQANAARVLFDGQSLDGWVTSGGHYDGNAVWTVEDGAITGRQNAQREGGLIYTAAPYTEFDLELDVRLDEPFDSGIFVRMAPVGRGAQLTLDVCPNGEVGAIYSDGFLLHNPRGRELWKRGAWNHVALRCSGADMSLHAELNGEPLADYTVPAGTPGFAPTGLIGLQVHGNRDDPPENKVQFKNIRLVDRAPAAREVFSADERGFLSPTAWGVANGWTPLFHGASLAGWETLGGTRGFEMQDGVLALLAEGDADTLATTSDFTDFELRLDFKLDELANSGVFLRAARDGSNPAFSGCEIQILDDEHWEAATKTVLAPWQHTGSLYGSIASGEPRSARPIGEWNTLEIRCQGAHIRTRLNGRLLYDADTLTIAPAQGEPFAQRAPSGFIGLQRHADQARGEAYAWFRNVFVRRL